MGNTYLSIVEEKGNIYQFPELIYAFCTTQNNLGEMICDWKMLIFRDLTF